MPNVSGWNGSSRRTRTQTDSALASLLLVDRAMELEVKPLTSKEYWSVVDAVGDPAKLLGQDAAWLAAHAGLPDGDRLARLLDGATRLAFQLEEMERTGLRVLTPFDGVQRGERHGTQQAHLRPGLLTFVVAADTEKGGTWAGATESLKRDIGEVAVWLGPGKGPGNDTLVEAGAIPIEHLDDLLTAPAREPEPSPANDQLSLDL